MGFESRHGEGDSLLASWKERGVDLNPEGERGFQEESWWRLGLPSKERV